jgi:hypothetical protein
MVAAGRKIIFFALAGIPFNPTHASPVCYHSADAPDDIPVLIYFT